MSAITETRWVIVVTLAATALAVAPSLASASSAAERGSEPLDLLAQRFARGEISADEYAQRRRLLEEGAR